LKSLRYPWSVEEPPRCPCCGDAGWLPSPFPACPFDYVLCPSCHQDHRWTVADDDGPDADALVDLAALATRPGRN
jgi:hypothetical protein